MRPSPAELISGVRRILRDVVEPDLNSEYAKARLNEVRAVLAQVDWNNAGLDLVRDASELQAVLSECRDWVVDDPARAERFETILADLDAELERRSNDNQYFAYSERKERYDAIVVALINPVEDWLAAHPEDERGRQLRRRLIQHYAS